MKELNLQEYEVLAFEPLHDTMNHISNMIKEIPHHITDAKVLITIKQVISVLFDKEKVRGTDYRRALLTLAAAILKDVSQDFIDLLLSFIEMTKVFYAHEEERCPRQILWLYNISWLHSKAIRKALCPPKALTYRKLFGIYYHAIIDHAPLIHRILCLRSINAEQTERCFDQIVDITKKTWNKHIEDLASNAFLHVQAEELTRADRDEVKIQEREIKKIASRLPMLTNVVVEKELMVTRAKEWQAHLMQIPDFLLPGPGVWWDWEADGGVKFYDCHQEDNYKPEGPTLHHFRSSSVNTEVTFLKECWKKCCNDNIELPLYKQYDNSGKLVFQRVADGESMLDEMSESTTQVQDEMSEETMQDQDEMREETMQDQDEMSEKTMQDQDEMTEKTMQDQDEMREETMQPSG